LPINLGGFLQARTSRDRKERLLTVGSRQQVA